MDQTAIKPMVPGGGIEPPTRGFSIPWHFNENNCLARKRSVDSLGTKGDSVNQKRSHSTHSAELGGV